MARARQPGLIDRATRVCPACHFREAGLSALGIIRKQRPWLTR